MDRLPPDLLLTLLHTTLTPSTLPTFLTLTFLNSSFYRTFLSAKLSLLRTYTLLHLGSKYELILSVLPSTSASNLDGTVILDLETLHQIYHAQKILTWASTTSYAFITTSISSHRHPTLTSPLNAFVPAPCPSPSECWGVQEPGKPRCKGHVSEFGWEGYLYPDEHELWNIYSNWCEVEEMRVWEGEMFVVLERGERRRAAREGMRGGEVEERVGGWYEEGLGEGERPCAHDRNCTRRAIVYWMRVWAYEALKEGEAEEVKRIRGGKGWKKLRGRAEKCAHGWCVPDLWEAVKILYELREKEGGSEREELVRRLAGMVEADCVGGEVGMYW